MPVDTTAVPCTVISVIPAEDVKEDPATSDSASFVFLSPSDRIRLELISCVRSNGSSDSSEGRVCKYCGDTSVNIVSGNSYSNHMRRFHQTSLNASRPGSIQRIFSRHPDGLYHCVRTCGYANLNVDVFRVSCTWSHPNISPDRTKVSCNPSWLPSVPDGFGERACLWCNAYHGGRIHLPRYFQVQSMV